MRGGCLIGNFFHGVGFRWQYLLFGSGVFVEFKREKQNVHCQWMI
jgi:hypothetical protein